MIRIEKTGSLIQIKQSWDTIITDYFQSSDFLIHLEKYNYCFQHYYVLYFKEEIKASAIVYKLPVNMLTYSNRSLSVKMKIIGVPASVDSSGLIGNENYFETLVEYIIKSERGLVLCLNYSSLLKIRKIVQLETLPSVVFNNSFESFEVYSSSMRHPYRRRIFKAIEQFKGIKTERTSCSNFTDKHYKLYLEIMKRSKTKLETLSFGFFSNLPEEFSLVSYYSEYGLVTWHITCKYRNVYSFLFGGIDYKLRDKYDAYYNNLYGIIKEGIECNCSLVNLGQTAELPKMRVGGQLIRKKMFIYHRSWILRLIFRLFGNQLGYRTAHKNLKVFKNEHFIY